MPTAEQQIRVARLLRIVDDIRRLDPEWEDEVDLESDPPFVPRYVVQIFYEGDDFTRLRFYHSHDEIDVEPNQDYASFPERLYDLDTGLTYTPRVEVQWVIER